VSESVAADVDKRGRNNSACVRPLKTKTQRIMVGDEDVDWGGRWAIGEGHVFYHHDVGGRRRERVLSV